MKRMNQHVLFVKENKILDPNFPINSIQPSRDNLFLNAFDNNNNTKSKNADLNCLNSKNLNEKSSDPIEKAPL